MAGGDPTNILMQIGPILLLLVLFYFMLIRPQQQRAKAHQAMLAAVKRGDQVVLSSGMIGKVVRVEDKEVGLEISQGVTVKVVKTMIAEVRGKGEPAAANDAKT
ncbi:MAG: preprotein translocase subunit YajC [Caulobacter sp.]|nr:preprotein translocase subunit YajC [Caulobacter sp.]